MSEQQLRSKLREQGHTSYEGLQAVVLETSGALAVISSREGMMPLLDGITPRR
jgi:uncharacterized membrane protein YcaP (DUF421 family)